MAIGDILTSNEPIEISPAGFVEGNEVLDSISVNVSYGIIERFSEGMYSSPNKAFEELVSNSYDAGACHVWVEIPTRVTADSTIAVLDDGDSMDLDGLRELWQVGESPKAANRELRNKERLQIGKFGIGKLATYVLARELTYLCRKGDSYLAVTMDYGMASGTLMTMTPMKLKVVELTADQAKTSLERVIPSRTLDDFLANTHSENWTCAILGSPKDKAQSLKIGRLRWILSTCLPVSPRFNLTLNGEQVEPSKALGDHVWSYEIGADDKKSGDKWPYCEGASDSQVHLKNAGDIRGVAELYSDSLQRGKSEELGRSHGFFVKVRQRLININDPTFGIDVELSHGVFTRFRMVVEADDLDNYIASARESLQESLALEELHDYMLAVFNRARGEWKKANEVPEREVLTASQRVSSAPPALSQKPLRRIVRRLVAGEKELAGALGIRSDSIESVKNLRDDDTLLREIVVETVKDTSRLVVYDPVRSAVVVNSEHPFIKNYLEDWGASEPLRLIGAAELLTEIYMLDENLPPSLVRAILERRDSFLRALVSIHPRSAPIIARSLRESENLEKELEDAVADALQLLGFSVDRIGGNGKPDGLASVRLGKRDDQVTGYSFTYDAKSTKHEKIRADTAHTNVLNVHRTDYSADYALLVAPGYQGADDEKSLISKLCENDRVTAITVEDLATLVEYFPFRNITPATLLGLFGHRTPDRTHDFVEKLCDTEHSGIPFVAIVKAIVDYSDRKDPVTIPALNFGLAERIHTDIGNEDLRHIVAGIAALAPRGIWWDGDKVALNTSIDKVVEEISKSIAPLPERLVGEMQAGLDAFR